MTDGIPAPVILSIKLQLQRNKIRDELLQAQREFNVTKLIKPVAVRRLRAAQSRYDKAMKEFKAFNSLHYR